MYNIFFKITKNEVDTIICTYLDYMLKIFGDFSMKIDRVILKYSFLWIQFSFNSSFSMRIIEIYAWVISYYIHMFYQYTKFPISIIKILVANIYQLLRPSLLSLSFILIHIPCIGRT